MRKLCSLSLAALVLVCLLAACAPPAPSSTSAPADVPSTASITYTYGMPVFPLGNHTRTITLFADGTATLTDRQVFDEEAEGWQPWPEGQAPLIKQHGFWVPQDAYAALESALFAAGFYAMEEDLGVHATDTSYDYITVETGKGSHTVGAAGWPDSMGGVLAAWRAALDAAYLQQGQLSAYPDAVLTSEYVMAEQDGGCMAQYAAITGDGAYTYTWATGLPAPTEEGDPFAALQPYPETGGYTSSHYIAPEHFTALVDAFLAQDFFNLPAQTPDMRESAHPDGTFYTQRYTLTLDGRTHTVTLPPGHGYIVGGTYDTLQTAWFAALEEYVDPPLTLEEIFAWPQ